MVRFTSAKTVFLIELTVPWEQEVEAAYERKRATYSELAAECRVAVCRDPVEVNYPGLIHGIIISYAKVLD